MNKVSLLVLLLSLSTSVVSAQGKKGGGASTSQGGNNSSNNSGGGGGGGSVTIESTMIAYEAVSTLADEIVSKTKASLSNQVNPGCPSSTKILLVDPVVQSQLAAFYSFKTSITALRTGYVSLAPGGSGPTAVSPTDWISAGISILSALRNTAVYSGQTFAPDDTVLETVLAKKFSEQNYTLVSSQIPGNMNKAASDISSLVKEVSDARAHVPAANQADFFKSLDQQWNSLQGSLASTDSNGNTVLATIISGEAIATSLGNCYPQLFAKTIATGGSSRTNHNFFVELFLEISAVEQSGHRIGDGLLFALSVQFGV